MYVHAYYVAVMSCLWFLLYKINFVLDTSEDTVGLVCYAVFLVMQFIEIAQLKIAK